MLPVNTYPLVPLFVRLCSLGLLLLLMALVPNPAQAASFTVSSTADTASSVDDPHTLRGAIAASQASADASDTITITATGKITLTQGELLNSNPKAITGKTVTITGPGESSLSVSGNSITRILHITGVTVNLSGVTLTLGNVSTGSVGGAGVLLAGAVLILDNCTVSNCVVGITNAVGAGIANLGGDLTLTSCLITGNTTNAMGSLGAGGIGSQDGSLSLTGCTVVSNTGGNLGGGIASYRETCVLTNSTVSSNQVSAAGSTTKSGGSGIYSEDDDLTLTNCNVSANGSDDRGDGYGLYLTGGSGKHVDLHNCAIFDNSGTANPLFRDVRGGGIYNAGATLSLTNCTVEGNGQLSVSTVDPATMNGGGIYNAGALTLTDCTVTENDETGLYNFLGGTARVTSTILAANLNGRATSESDVFTATGGAITSGGSNLIGDPDGNGFVNDPHHTDPNSSGNHDQTGVTQPGLNLTSGNNGGSTLTIALTAGSSAIDADFADSTLTDQRGAPRPFGVRNDIGAFEYGATAPKSGISSVVTNTQDGGAGSLRAAILNAELIPGSTVTFDPSVFGPGKPQTIMLTSGPLQIFQGMTITGPGASVLTISGGNVSQVMTITTAAFISGLTIMDGNAGSAPFSGGGGIDATNSVTGGLTMTDCVISHCTAPARGGEGGGIRANVPLLRLTRCVVTGNSAPNYQGGGIYSASATGGMTGCTISGNSANAGGGLFLNSAFGVVVDHSTISGNTAVTGGGIDNAFDLVMTASTVTGNTAATGGGIYSPGVGSLYFCTVTGNTAKSGGGLDGSATGGSLGGTSCLATIVSGNTGGNVAGTQGSLGYNLIGDPNGNGFTNGVNHDQTGVTNPKLRPLHDNGGPTETIALLPGSPAIDAIPLLH